MKNIGSSANSALKSAEKEALAKIGKVSVAKEVTSKAPPLKGAGIANVGVAGTLAGTGN